MALTIPTKPKAFRPDLPPPGYRSLYVSFAAERKRITPRLQLIHTNGAANQGSIESSKAWSERRTYNGTTTTLPTFQVDMDGDAAQFIDSDQYQNACYRANGFAISYETADSGYKADPTISAFTEPQLQALANGVAYCATLYKIPLAYPTAWDGSGTASHTEPFGYPYWTNSSGKICPGQKKKAQVRDIIIPHAIKIVQAWSGTTPPPTTPPPTSGGGTYTVVAGDSWWSISKKLGVPMDALIAANPPATSSTVIHPGQVLNVPGGTTPSPTPPTNWATEGAKMSTPPASMSFGKVWPNCTWLQAVLCSMPKTSADGGGAIFNPAWVGFDSSVNPAKSSTSNYYGDATRSALAYWQGRNGLTADGQYGSATANKMASVRGK